jgi:hypothetical protein
MKYNFLVLIAAFFTPFAVFSQGERKDKTAVTYEEIYDEPYSVNSLFVQLQPLYGEFFGTNPTAGFGLESSYYLKDKLDFRAHFRKTYTEKFFDYSRDLANKNSNVDNKQVAFLYYELGATYHAKDFEQSSKTKMFLYKKSYKGGLWAARVPLNAVIPCKVRKIYGVRLGAMAWQSTAELGRAMALQDLTNDDLKDSEGNGLPLTYNDGNVDLPVDAFSNIYSKGVYLGGSLTMIKNVAVNFDKFEEGIDDLIFTAYFDILYAPSLKVDDVVYTYEPNDPNFPGETHTFDVSPIKTSSFGFRAGLDGKFNRMLSWGYGGEIGYRPTFKGMGFYALIKISFPIFGTNLDYKVESFGK